MANRYMHVDLDGRTRADIKSHLRVAVQKLMDKTELPISSICKIVKISEFDVYSITGAGRLRAPRRLLIKLKDILDFNCLWTTELEYYLIKVRKLKHNSGL